MVIRDAYEKEDNYDYQQLLEYEINSKSIHKGLSFSSRGQQSIRELKRHGQVMISDIDVESILNSAKNSVKANQYQAPQARPIKSAMKPQNSREIASQNSGQLATSESFLLPRQVSFKPSPYR